MHKDLFVYDVTLCFWQVVSKDLKSSLFRELLDPEKWKITTIWNVGN